MASGPKKADRLVDEGAVLYRNGDYNSALHHYTAAIAVDPNSARAWYNRSLVFVTLGDYASADSDRSEALQLDPRMSAKWTEESRAASDGFVALANHYMMNNNPEKALEYYKAAERLNPENSDAIVGCGIVYYNSGDDEKAISAYTSALGLQPNNTAALLNRAIALGAKNNYLLAINDLNKLIDIDQNDNEAYTIRSEYYDALGDAERAEADRQTARRNVSSDQEKAGG